MHLPRATPSLLMGNEINGTAMVQGFLNLGLKINFGKLGTRKFSDLAATRNLKIVE